jgi:hypothetical protein
VRAAIPGIHAAERGVVLVDHPHRRLADLDQIVIGDDERHLEDSIAVRLEAGHLEVDPDQAVRILRHRAFA